MRLLLPSLALLLLSGVRPGLPGPRPGLRGPLVGEWVNTDGNTKSITRLIVATDDKIHAWAKCSPTDCDWNSVPLQSLGNDQYKAEFRTTYETNTLDIRWVRDPQHTDGLLHVKDLTAHAGQNGQRAWTKESPELVFAKQGMKKVKM